MTLRDLDERTAVAAAMRDQAAHTRHNAAIASKRYGAESHVTRVLTEAADRRTQEALRILGTSAAADIAL